MSDVVSKMDNGSLLVWGPVSVEAVSDDDKLITMEAIEESLPRLLKRKRGTVMHKDQMVGDIHELAELDPGRAPDDQAQRLATHLADRFGGAPTGIYQVDDEIAEAFPHLSDRVGDKVFFAAMEVWDQGKLGEMVQEAILDGDLDSYSLSGMPESIHIIRHCDDAGCRPVDRVDQMDLSAITLGSRTENHHPFGGRVRNPGAAFVLVQQSDVMGLVEQACPLEQGCSCGGSCADCHGHLHANGNGSAPRVAVEELRDVFVEAGEKLDRCVEDVTADRMAEGEDVDEATSRAYAICRDSLDMLAQKLGALQEAVGYGDDERRDDEAEEADVTSTTSGARNPRHNGDDEDEEVEESAWPLAHRFPGVVEQGELASPDTVLDALAALSNDLEADYTPVKEATVGPYQFSLFDDDTVQVLLRGRHVEVPPEVMQEARQLLEAMEREHTFIEWAPPTPVEEAEAPLVTGFRRLLLGQQKAPPNAVRISSPGEAPTGVRVQKGPRGGLFYVPGDEQDEGEMSDKFFGSDEAKDNTVDGLRDLEENVTGRLRGVREDIENGDMDKASERLDVILDDEEFVDEMPPDIVNSLLDLQAGLHGATGDDGAQEPDPDAGEGGGETAEEVDTAWVDNAPDVVIRASLESYAETPPETPEEEATRDSMARVAEERGLDVPDLADESDAPLSSSFNRIMLNT